MAKPIISFILLTAVLMMAGTLWSKPDQYDHYEVVVDGMACPFCAYGIEKQLDRITGISETELDVSAGVIRLSVDENVVLDESAVRRAVEKAGFSLRALRGPAAE